MGQECTYKQIFKYWEMNKQVTKRLLVSLEGHEENAFSELLELLILHVLCVSNCILNSGSKVFSKHTLLLDMKHEYRTTILMRVKLTLFWGGGVKGLSRPHGIHRPLSIISCQIVTFLWQTNYNPHIQISSKESHFEKRERWTPGLTTGHFSGSLYQEVCHTTTWVQSGLYLEDAQKYRKIQQGKLGKCFNC